MWSEPGHWLGGDSTGLPRGALALCSLFCGAGAALHLFHLFHLFHVFLSSSLPLPPFLSFSLSRSLFLFLSCSVSSSRFSARPSRFSLQPFPALTSCTGYLEEKSNAISVYRFVVG